MGYNGFKPAQSSLIFKTMKVSFMPNLQRMAETSTATATLAAITPAPPLTSEKLTALKSEQIAKDAEIMAEKDFDKRLEMSKQMFKITNDIAAEIAAIQKANIAAKLKEAQDAKLAVVTNFEAAVLADAKVQAGKGTTDEKAASADSLTKLRTELQNMVLGTVAKVAGADKTAGAATGTKGAKSAEIVALHVANLAAGMTATESKKAIEAAGHSRGTTGAVVLAWEKEQGIK